MLKAPVRMLKLAYPLAQAFQFARDTGPRARNADRPAGTPPNGRSHRPARAQRRQPHQADDQPGRHRDGEDSARRLR